MTITKQVCFCLLVLLHAVSCQIISEEEVSEFLKTVFEQNATSQCKIQNVAEWAYATNITTANSEALVEATLKTSEVNKHFYDTVFKALKPDKFQSESVKRQIKFLKELGHSVLPDVDLKNLTDIVNKMTDIYSVAKICPFKEQNCKTPNLTLEPDIEGILANPKTSYEELEYVWKAWRDATGKKMINDYPIYVKLANKAAKGNGYVNEGESWKSDYETDHFVEEMDKLWAQIEPLYKKLHQYVRIKLIEKYGEARIGQDGNIPAHLLGNMWAQSWTNLGSLMKPYPNESKVDVTAALIAQNYTVKKMFETSNAFYMSLGLPTNEMSYDESKGALITKPKDREVLCHASAWDFCDGITYRIKMCTEVNSEDFITIHHEMGHIQYFIQYKKQPFAFRSGANPGFHEAIGDTIALSVATPKHLKAIGLLQNYTETKEAAINALMDMALERLAFLPFGLLIDKWRWDVFSGEAKEANWNAHWWDLREKYQGIKAPINRTSSDFDPGAKYHVAGDSQYINYFVAHILQFQLYRGLCIEAGQYDPKKKNEKALHDCDFYKSKAAGTKLAAGLSKGMSEHWSKALTAMTGETTLDASAILEYFQPLDEYLSSVLPKSKKINVKETKKSNANVHSSTFILVIAFSIYNLLL